MIKRLLTVLLLCVAANPAWAGGDPVAGKTKAAACASCHGADGNGSPANKLWPKLAGQHASYLVKQLKEFKSATRKDPTMGAMVAALSEADMQDIAAYFASQEIKHGAASKETLAHGEQLYRGGIAERGLAACASCHGPAGAGNPAAGFPSIAGQNAEYAAKALKDFRSGARSNDPQGMMRDIAVKMRDEDIQAVADYLAGLH
jgi:cytochrome c553